MSTQPRGFVLDASAALDLLLQFRSARRIGELIEEPLALTHVPETIDREVINVLRKRTRTGQLDEWQANSVFRQFLQLPVEIHPARPLAYRVWTLRSTCSVGDAYYVALAEAVNGTLVTSDEKLARGVREQVGVEIVVP